METFYTQSNAIYEEPLLPVAVNNQAPDGWLFFEPRELLRVTSGDGLVRYEQDHDFYLQGRRLILTPYSPISFLRQTALYPRAHAPRAKGTRRDSDRWLLWDEGPYLSSRQLRVSYTHTGWDIPSSHSAGDLPHTREILERGDHLRIGVWGDSIAAGGNASAYTGISPWLPPFPDRVCLLLERHYRTHCTLHNEAVPGTTSSWGSQHVEHISRFHPMLCIIAFGMNDGFRRVSPADYARNIRFQMENIKSVSPDCEFVLVATMWGNPERVESAIDLYAPYREELKALCGKGCALADLTTPWEGFLQRKRPTSLYASGINHPGDFGHAFYAQTIFQAITRTPDA